MSPHHSSNSTGPVRPGDLNAAARVDFDLAHFKAFWRDVLGFLTQSSNELLPYDEVRKHLPWRGQHHLGLQQVPIASIVGSVSRYQDFDRAFLPRQTYTRRRWESVDQAHLQDIELPPVELYKVGSIYFVKDGNHRVSVAREKGQLYIDAVVVEVDVAVPMEPGIRLDELILRQERADFYAATGLQTVRPEVRLELTLTGQYEKLLDHIAVHRWYLGIGRRAEVPYPEAVASWYDRVYLPLVDIIRRRNVLREFPRRTEADLYLWILEHRWFLGEAYADEVSLEHAAEHFMREYSQRRARRLVKWVQGALRNLGGYWYGRRRRRLPN